VTDVPEAGRPDEGSTGSIGDRRDAAAHPLESAADTPAAGDPDAPTEPAAISHAHEVPATSTDGGSGGDGNLPQPDAETPPVSADAVAAAPSIGHALEVRASTDERLALLPSTDERLALVPSADGVALTTQAPVADQPPPWGMIPAPPAEPVAVDVAQGRQGIGLAQVKEEVVAWVKTLASAAVYAVLIVTFGFQVARVEGQSMAPTLEDQDRLVVNKLVYRIADPRRGDIVMLYYPLNPEKSFVKRVIAEEGDTVRIVDGRVYVNDIPLKDDYVASEYRSHDDWGPQVIPEGYYFVMGDHRNNSSDSRHWGMVPKKYIIGKVQIRWWPVPTARVF
jgi:signal peptidase I